VAAGEQRVVLPQWEPTDGSRDYTSPTLKIGTPRVLFEGEFVSSFGSRANWNSLDGRRFLLVKRVE
jgi:hypothetical protein